VYYQIWNLTWNILCVVQDLDALLPLQTTHSFLSLSLLDCYCNGHSNTNTWGIQYTATLVCCTLTTQTTCHMLTLYKFDPAMCWWVWCEVYVWRVQCKDVNSSHSPTPHVYTSALAMQGPTCSFSGLISKAENLTWLINLRDQPETNIPKCDWFVCTHIHTAWQYIPHSEACANAFSN